MMIGLMRMRMRMSLPEMRQEMMMRGSRDFAKEKR